MKFQQPLNPLGNSLYHNSGYIAPRGLDAIRSRVAPWKRAPCFGVSYCSAAVLAGTGSDIQRTAAQSNRTATITEQNSAKRGVLAKAAFIIQGPSAYKKSRIIICSIIIINSESKTIIMRKNNDMNFQQMSLYNRAIPCTITRDEADRGCVSGAPFWAHGA